MEDFSKYSDIENTINEKLNYKDKEIFKVVKDDIKIKYVWYNETESYTVLSNLEEHEILKFIENIKILKNF